jgi:hypothetical protein
MHVVCDSVTRRRMQLIVDVRFHVSGCSGAAVLDDVGPYLDGMRDLRALLKRLYAPGSACLTCQTAYRFVSDIVDACGVREFPDFTQAEYDAALPRIRALWEAPRGSEEEKLFDDLAARVADFERVLWPVPQPLSYKQRAFSDVFAHLYMNAVHCRQLREDLDAGMDVRVDWDARIAQSAEEARGLWLDAEKLLAKAASEG